MASCAILLPSSTFWLSQRVERILHARGDELHGVARGEALLGLALELRVEHARREHVAQRFPRVLGLQADPAREQLVVLAEFLHRFVHRVAQARLVGAAERGGDEVHERLALAAGLGPCDRPRCAFALGVLGVVGPAIGLAGEDRAHVGAGGILDALLQVGAEAACVFPLAAILLAFLLERDGEARQQHRLRAEQHLEVRSFDARAVEVLRIGPRAHERAAFPRPRLAGLPELRCDVAAREGDLVHGALARHAHLEALGQGVGDRDAHAVQAAREGVRAAALLVELAARVQLREDDLDGRRLLDRMRAHRDAAPVVLDAHRAVGVQRHRDARRVSAQRLVGRVVDDLLDDVQRTIGARVHPRPCAHRLQSLEDLDRLLVVFRNHIMEPESGVRVTTPTPDSDPRLCSRL